ncbi:hypothetical protein QEJ31_03385 [Pigmentibacter sp. JX0631]|uniref:hypothetical protein n=1 Tax=Pigmentibacter sp. JX0631 TaxID=2976982 RepID=UPI0024698C5B|nr:hypothetical protein [Pigmentibacter sp. JX0631]WGL60645.1 hypothetical protein QEJ31_03385 [Pigmentibacter sp. JX0631]
MTRKFDQQNTKDKNEKSCHVFLKRQRHSLMIPYKKLIIAFSILTQSLFFMNELFAQDEVVEKFDYVPDFRAGHNLSLLLSGEYSTWNFHQNSASSNQNVISDFSKTGGNAAFYLRYAYHINIISFFGFFIGTTAGILSEVESYGKLSQGYGVLFPTLLGGLVANMGQHFRLLSGFEYGATWYPEMKITTNSGNDKMISPVPDMFSAFVGLDYFVTRNKAITFQGGWRKQSLIILNNGSSNTYLNTIGLENESYFVALGLTLQIGDFNQAISSVLPKR